jgi:COPII coat assembly protein SEC16
MQFGQRRASQDQPSPTVDSHPFQGAPMYGSPGATGYQPTPPQSSYMPLAPVEEDASTHTQSPADTAPSMQPAVNGLFYQPPAQNPASASQSPYYQGPPGMPQSESPRYMPSSAANAYEPPAGGSSYEPPSYAPQVNVDPAPEGTEESTEQDEKPKKSFMDDDDDDDLAKRAAAIQKAENDRKADEAFRKAAEEDGKQATYDSLRPNSSI